MGRLIARGLPWQAAWDLPSEQGNVIAEGIEAERQRMTPGAE